MLTHSHFHLPFAVDIPRAQTKVRFFATAILHFPSGSHNMEGEAVNYKRQDLTCLHSTLSQKKDCPAGPGSPQKTK